MVATTNPFREVQQPRDVTVTFRMTKAEHDAVRAIVGNKRGAIKNFIREGLNLATEARLKRRKA